ncbi:MAG: hypothetical protein M3405_09560 [Acidobacteriota bacterium]|jgi:hypothetical protein|nr:hypothetical protein [Acidobacteriota bacterium]
MLTTIETTGTINANHQIELDEKLPDNLPSRVRVLVLFDEDADIDEREWKKAASGNEIFDFLNDEGEDIYTLEDGKPLDNEK